VDYEEALVIKRELETGEGWYAFQFESHATLSTHPRDICSDQAVACRVTGKLHAGHSRLMQPLKAGGYVMVVRSLRASCMPKGSAGWLRHSPLAQMTNWQDRSFARRTFRARAVFEVNNSQVHRWRWSTTKGCVLVERAHSLSATC
jgi:hypothetical protein